MEYFKPKYDKFMQEDEASTVKSKLKIRFNSYKNRLEKMQNDLTNDKIYYGVAYVIWNNQVNSKGTAFSLQFPNNNTVYSKYI